MNTEIDKSIKSKINVKKELGTELIKKLDELQFSFYQTNPNDFESNVRTSYESIRKSIGFSLVPQKSIK